MRCTDEFPEGKCDDESLEWFRGTKWHWNKWREVSFEHDGKFSTPTPDCQVGGVRGAALMAKYSSRGRRWAAP